MVRWAWVCSGPVFNAFTIAGGINGRRDFRRAGEESSVFKWRDEPRRESKCILWASRRICRTILLRGVVDARFFLHIQWNILFGEEHLLDLRSVS